MPEERDIEKQLRDHAKQRRAAAGEPFQMDGATRNLLQREVARRAGQTTPENKSWSWMVLFRWPGFALSLSVLIVVALLVPVLVKREGRFELAKEISKTPPDGRIAGESKNFALDDFSSDRMENRGALAAANKETLKENGRDKSLAVVSGSLADTPRAAAEKDAEITNSVELFSVNISSPSAPTSKAEIQPAGSSGQFVRTDVANFGLQKSTDREVGDEKAKLSGGKFVSGIPRKTDVDAKNLLASFQFIQTGDEIKIIDADGSVYSGHLIADEEIQRRTRQYYYDLDGVDKKLGEPKNALAAGGGGGVARKSANAFQVLGTNLTLNASITITAGFFDDVVTRSLSELESKTAARKPATAIVTKAAPAQPAATRIFGTVRVGERESLIEARRVTP